MKFNKLAQYFEELEKTSSRLKITDILSDLLKNSDKDEIDKVVYLSLGILAPSFKGIVFNLADQMMMRAISEAYDTNIEKVKSLYKEKGDLGLVSFSLAKKKETSSSVNEIFEKLMEAAKEGGEGSQERRVTKIAEILSSVDPLSAKFITRIPMGNLRLGFSDKTVIDALAIAKYGDKTKKGKIQKAYEVMPDIGAIAKEIPDHPKPVLGIPVYPMLAQRLNSPEEMVKKMGEVGIEPKFDGLRVQIHFERGGEFYAFTRNLHNISQMFPELKKLGEHISADDVILDSEGIGIDEKTKKILDFQSIMTRRRKHEIESFAKSIPANFYVFDILYKNGESLMDKSYLERRKILKETIKGGSLLKVDEEIITKDSKEIANFYTQKIKEGMEGIMVKKADSGYIPGRTGWRWVKMKQLEKAEGKLSDTVDCVVMGFTQGKGKRASFGLGQFLVGIKDGDEIKTVTKVGTGLTDVQFKELKIRLEKLKVKNMPKEYQVSKILTPDFWVKPSLVVEIAADDITKSPNHTASFALRFPRLVKFRDDKSVNEATTKKEIEKLYKLQKK
ncbi:MAG TPA: ATP-dependent DNA ligase [Candidatus Saccharimonadales bacterium]|nr:ATP-dependent DNA ligase [Candidatus Saccharimonadales bacterium]